MASMMKSGQSPFQLNDQGAVIGKLSSAVKPPRVFEERLYVRTNQIGR